MTTPTEREPGTDSRGPLMTQTQARREANQLRARGIWCVAATVPLGAWGGQEDGWTVYIGDPNGQHRTRRT